MNTNPTTLRARELRATPNPAEQKLWTMLKNRQLGGYKFTRQFPIGPYFADFACRRSFLVVEIDGSQHVANEYDRARDAFICAEGYSVLRVWSVHVLQNCDGMCAMILEALEGRLPECDGGFDYTFRRSQAEARHITRRRLLRANTGT